MTITIPRRTKANAITLVLVSLVVAAALILVVYIVVDYNQRLAFASSIELYSPLEGPMSDNSATLKNFTISFENGTRATLNDTVISQDRGDYLIYILNTVLGGAEEDELPTFSQVELEDRLALAAQQQQREELQEEQQQEETSSSSGGSDSSDSSDSDSDSGSEGIVEQPGDSDTFPENMQPQPQPQPDDNGDNGSESDSEGEESTTEE